MKGRSGVLTLVGLAWLLGLGGCRPSPAGDPEATTASQRIARLRAETASAMELLADPPPWLAALPELDNRDRPSPSGFLARASSERVIWDGELVDRVIEPLPEDRQEWRGPLATLVAFADDLRRLKIDLLVVPIPPRAAVLSQELLGEAAEQRLYDGHFRRFLLALEEQGVEVVDLLPGLRRQPHREFTGELPADIATFRESVFRRQDSHWTTYGSGQAAVAIAQRVRRFAWFAGVAQVQGRARLVSEVEWKRRLGPIARRLQAASRPPAEIEPELYLRRRVRIVGERWSFEHRQSPVLLIGDSFVQPQHGLADHLLEELGFRVDRIGVSGEIPSGALTALAYRGDRLRGKRLVIWVFASYSLNRWQQWRPVPMSGAEGE